MEFDAKEYKLNDRQTLQLRKLEGHDVEELLKFYMKIAHETENTVRYPEEIHLSVDQEVIRLNTIAKSKFQCSIGAFINQRLVGNIHFYCLRDCIKLRHRASFGLTVIQEMWGKGIATILMKEMIELLIQQHYEILELEVMSNNNRAISLYERMGFVECGRIPNGIKLKDGTYVDLITMYKSLV